MVDRPIHHAELISLKGNPDRLKDQDHRADICYGPSRRTNRRRTASLSGTHLELQRRHRGRAVGNQARLARCDPVGCEHETQRSSWPEPASVARDFGVRVVEGVRRRRSLLLVSMRSAYVARVTGSGVKQASGG
jgi:hypothetical protein